MAGATGFRCLRPNEGSVLREGGYLPCGAGVLDPASANNRHHHPGPRYARRFRNLLIVEVHSPSRARAGRRLLLPRSAFDWNLAHLSRSSSQSIGSLRPVAGKRFGGECDCGEMRHEKPLMEHRGHAHTDQRSSRMMLGVARLRAALAQVRAPREISGRRSRGSVVLLFDLPFELPHCLSVLPPNVKSRAPMRPKNGRPRILQFP